MASICVSCSASEISDSSRWVLSIGSRQGLVLLVLVCLGASGGCRKQGIVLSDLACKDGECLPGWECDTETELCVPADPICRLGQIESCTSCSDDCRVSVQNAAPICVEPSPESFACDYEGDCTGGFADADLVRNNGCECEPTGLEIPCSGRDEDCLGGDGVITGQIAHCSGCGDDCLAGTWVTAAICDGSGAAPVCRITACVSGWVDQDGVASNGCEQSCTITGDESCDGLDNDCDGTPDDMSQVEIDTDCEAEAPGTFVTVWSCANGCVVEACAAGHWDNNQLGDDGCEYACVGDGAETCNGQDDDCNEVIDDVTNIDGECAGIFSAATEVAAWTCVSGGCAVRDCRPGYIDADRQPDNGCERPCTPDTPADETCDGQDDDCNGTVDDVPAATLAAACAAQYPTAGNVQTWGCVDGSCAISACTTNHWDNAGGVANGCEYACTLDGAEICDGEDDDCDGAVDTADTQLDTAAELAADCRAQYPLATSVRSWGCSGACVIAECQTHYWDDDGMVGTGCEYPCNPTTPGAEICDGEDNDCNHEIDGADLAMDTPAEVNQVCATMQCSSCGVASWSCTGQCEVAQCDPDQWDDDTQASNGCEYTCTPSNPTTEVCDGADNDCDQDIDTADSDLDQASELNADCGTQHCAICSVDNWTCVMDACVASDCAAGHFDANGLPGDGCESSCVPETDPAFCQRLGTNCGLVTAADNCGDTRTDVDCGSCTLPEVCGGGWGANVCGSWWDCAWSARQRLTVTTGPAAPVPAGYSVSFTFDHAALVTDGSSLASGDDVRVVRRDPSNGNWSELPRVLDPDSQWSLGATTIWFAVAIGIAGNSSNASHFLYFDNSGAGAPPADEDDVFHFADFFERPDSDTVGNDWVEHEDNNDPSALLRLDRTSSPTDGQLWTESSLNHLNRPAAEHAFASLDQRLAWRFGFNWIWTSSESAYRVHMQLGQASEMESPPSSVPSNAGIGPSLSWTNNGGTIELQRDVGGSYTTIVALNEYARIDVLVGFGGTPRYNVLVNGSSVATNVGFSSAVTALDTMRFYTWGLQTYNFNPRGIRYVVVRPLVNDEPTVTAGAPEADPCP